MNLRLTTAASGSYPLSIERVLGSERRVLDEAAFQRMISLERKRSERSRTCFVLMLLDNGRSSASEKHKKIIQSIGSHLVTSTRETDVTGWYKELSILGVVFTDLAREEKNSTLSALLLRVTNALKNVLTFEQFGQVQISFHVFPEDWEHDEPCRSSDPALYPDLVNRDESQRTPRIIKRIMDVGGSMAALLLFSPVFIAIAAAIKMSSTGPVFFRQFRIGQYGTPFVFLKFRSMYATNSSDVHQKYVRQLIAGEAEKQGSNRLGVYKLIDDPRITKLGKFLRRTSLDELPQFINVLRGEMSLVGPRPPIKYEVEEYDIWHRRRLLEAKPGITGLWQVNGRSRVKFDEMVRLDLRYSMTWSVWEDLKILLRTPLAVVLGEGAH